jgi:Tfp pilus assembly protein PilN
MSRVNLLPPEVRRARADAKRARSVVVVAAALAALLGGVYLVRTLQVLSLNGDLADVRSEQATVQAEIDSFAEVAANQAALGYGERVVESLLAGEVSWSQQMLHFATTVPDGFTLTSLSGSLSGDPTQPVIGSLSWTATSAGYVPTETWLTRLAAQEGWANAWLSSAAPADTGLTVGGSVDLTADAITIRGGGPA